MCVFVHLYYCIFGDVPENLIFGFKGKEVEGLSLGSRFSTSAERRVHMWHVLVVGCWVNCNSATEQGKLNLFLLQS